MLFRPQASCLRQAPRRRIPRRNLDNTTARPRSPCRGRPVSSSSAPGQPRTAGIASLQRCRRHLAWIRLAVADRHRACLPFCGAVTADPFVRWLAPGMCRDEPPRKRGCPCMPDRAAAGHTQAEQKSQTLPQENNSPFLVISKASASPTQIIWSKQVSSVFRVGRLRAKTGSGPCRRRGSSRTDWTQAVDFLVSSSLSVDSSSHRHLFLETAAFRCLRQSSVGDRITNFRT